MSQYTTEIRFLCETMAGLEESQGYSNVDDIIHQAIPKIFDFNFPIFDESYRVELETKILKHFYTREIGAETVGLWKLWLNTTMNEIMPEMNKYYESTLLEYNPLYATDMHTERVRKTKGENENTTTGSSTTDTQNGSTDKYSDTPQGGLTGVIEGTYLTSARVQDETGTSGTEFENVANGNFEDNEDFAEHVYGYNGWSPSKLVEDFRKAIINVDLMVIQRLEPLFMQIW